MSVHVPILKNEIVSGLFDDLQLPTDESSPRYVVDCTFGGGGHSEALLERMERLQLGDQIQLLALDQDRAAVEQGRARFKSQIDRGVMQIEHTDFAAGLGQLAPGSVVALLADLGFSSDQIEDGERGLSFLRDGPLDMRLDPSQGVAASVWLGRAREEEIADVIFLLGEERFSRRIARLIVEKRTQGQPIGTTLELADLVRRAYPPAARHSSRIHPATRTFQAMRIHVNDELGQLDRLLGGLAEKVGLGGRAAFLTFHSLEDRKVKQFFKGANGCKQTTKKPVEPSEEEIARNPRSRSAKLRIASRVVS